MADKHHTEEPVLVSVIIPAKNESRWLPQCLDALNGQRASTGRMEIIVVDNGSTDDTVEIAKKKGAIVYEQPNLNIAGLRNYGVGKASGSVLGFVDADVVVGEGWLKAATDCLGQDPRTGCVGSFPDVPGDAGWVTKNWWYLQAPDKLTESTGNFEVEWLPSMNMVVRKEVFDKVKGFRTDLITCEDVDFCYRLRETHKILYCKDLRAVHYGEAQDLAHLFRKERWRGVSNYDGLLYHGLRKDEIPSLLLPIYYLAVTLWLFVAMASQSFWGVVMAFTACLVPPGAKAFLQAGRLGVYRRFPQMAVVALIYCISRTVAALDWLRVIIFSPKV